MMSLHKELRVQLQESGKKTQNGNLNWVSDENFLYLIYLS
jgi:hypothetical protein